jgi:5'-nucleotidase
MEEMLAAGHDVRICTAPLTAFTHCVTEKYQWVQDHLGPHWVRRIVLTKDKTLVRGDVLMDDKPEVTGCLVPSREHLVFEAPYNLGSPARRVNWANWRQVLAEVEHERAARLRIGH